MTTYTSFRELRGRDDIGDKDLAEKVQLAVMYLDVPRPPHGTHLREYLTAQRNDKISKITYRYLGDSDLSLTMVTLKDLKSYFRWLLEPKRKK